MSRHSQHSNDRSFHSAKERQDAGYFTTKKEVMGTDCFLPFGYCGLSLKAPKDPVCTPEGYIYDREFILESLLTQKLEAQAHQKKFEEQERKKAKKEAVAKNKEDMKEVEEFRRCEQAIVSEDHTHKRWIDAKDALAPGAPETKKLRKGELMAIDKSAQRAHCFWVKETTKNAAPTELKPPDMTTRCPLSGSKLRAKDLIPVKFEVLDQKMLDRGGDRGYVCCAVSKHSITHEQAVLLKPSGVVILEKYLKDCVFKDMRCPVTGEQIKGKEDILKLKQGGTGFSAHNEVEAKSFSAIRSFLGDSRTSQGHLPRAGYNGLR